MLGVLPTPQGVVRGKLQTNTLLCFFFPKSLEESVFHSEPNNNICKPSPTCDGGEGGGGGEKKKKTLHL